MHCINLHALNVHVCVRHRCKWRNSGSVCSSRCVNCLCSERERCWWWTWQDLPSSEDCADGFYGFMAGVTYTLDVWLESCVFFPFWNALWLPHKGCDCTCNVGFADYACKIKILWYVASYESADYCDSTTIKLLHKVEHLKYKNGNPWNLMDRLVLVE